MRPLNCGPTANTADLLGKFSDNQPEIEISVSKYQPSVTEKKIEVHILHINPLKAELNPICHLLALLGAHHILHDGRIRVKNCVPLKTAHSFRSSNELGIYVLLLLLLSLLLRALW